MGSPLHALHRNLLLLFLALCSSFLQKIPVHCTRLSPIPEDAFQFSSRLLLLSSPDIALIYAPPSIFNNPRPPPLPPLPLTLNPHTQPNPTSLLHIPALSRSHSPNQAHLPSPPIHPQHPCPHCSTYLKPPHHTNLALPSPQTPRRQLPSPFLSLKTQHVNRHRSHPHVFPSNPRGCPPPLHGIQAGGKSGGLFMAG